MKLSKNKIRYNGRDLRCKLYNYTNNNIAILLISENGKPEKQITMNGNKKIEDGQVILREEFFESMLNSSLIANNYYQKIHYNNKIGIISKLVIENFIEEEEIK